MAQRPRGRLSDQLAEHLVAQLRAGVWQPHQPLPTEAALMREHGVSRTVVREAVSRLKSLGLLDSRQGSGVYVRADAGIQPLDLQSSHAASLQAVLHIVEVRRALEAEAAALAAQRRTAAQLDAIVQAMRAVDDAVAQAQSGAGRFVIAGGETSGAVVQALGLRRLRIGVQIDPGVPWCAGSAALPAGAAPLLHLALKSGNFGGEDFFTRAFAVLDAA
jgi:DNA-binding GntR family transcriptional regulator